MIFIFPLAVLVCVLGLFAYLAVQCMWAVLVLLFAAIGEI